MLVAPLLVLGLAGIIPQDAERAEPSPLREAHAHNDYEHPRPLLDALDHGFCSVEVDVHLVDGELLVAHARSEVRPERTLEALYLDPLAARVAANAGRVHRDGPLEFLLWIDCKTAGEPTYRAVCAALRRHRSMLTRFGSTGREPGAVTVLLTGNRPADLVAAETERHWACDGGYDDADPLLYPTCSLDWRREFGWRGTDAMPEAQRRRLDELVTKVHGQGRKLRYWGTPEVAELWTTLLDAGVDLLNTDELAAMRTFLVARTTALDTILPLDDHAELFVPAGFDPATRDARLVIHLHGAPRLARAAFAPIAGSDTVLLTLHLDGKSSVYRERFATPGSLSALRDRAAAELGAIHPTVPLFATTVLTAFSAGYGGVREVLRDPNDRATVDAVLLADGLHADLVDGAPDPDQMAPFIACARRALHGETRLWITHSAIDPVSYASTTACADALLAAVELPRTPWQGAETDDLIRASRATRAGLDVRGFTGTTAADHVAHFRYLWRMLDELRR